LLTGIILLLASVVCYITNIVLIRHYLNKSIPGVLEIDEILSPPPPGKEYLWEKTAGSGIVPKWVSIIGLSSIPLLVIGVIFIIVHFIMN